MNELKGFFKLSHLIKIYVPSTNHSFPIDPTKYINNIQLKFSEFFGGSTSTDAIGSWLSNDKTVISEKVTIVYSFCTPDQITKYFPDVIQLCQDLKIELNQESIALEYDNKLYLI